MLSGENHIHVSSANTFDRVLILDSEHGAVGVAVEQVREIFLFDKNNINIETDSSTNIVGTVLHDR